MIKIIKKIVRENRKKQSEILALTQEVLWANIYHDSIRGKEYLEKLSLNIGRWAGNYPFFYLLNRIMHDAKPERILEFGLGESSKFISVCLENNLKRGIHQIIEQSDEWNSDFNSKFKLSSFSDVAVCPIKQKTINGFEVNCYDLLENHIHEKYDLYLIDGPFGSPRFSRYDVIMLAEKLTASDEFIMIVDDSNRQGEKDTINELCKLFKNKNIKIYQQVFHGEKQTWIVTTQKYRFLTSI
ncbi:hypothetical protein [Flavobacterium sp. LM4]|uniref:hypothetical protein n=1 Tax=Flavobacterium sp. LM4 TaxID=1938609 RepID=UPI00099284CC|nr:hypothetical protein [Flavobacterium sp. LM4]OOV18376.1 hypothetical protein BXU10_01260 [Flavobacterium sp. LM4]